MALRDIKEKIASVKKTAKVTKAMESVSAVKMRRAQQVALSAREYAFFAFWALKRLSHAAGAEIDEYFLAEGSQEKKNKTGIILVSPDKGLAGAINTNLFKAFEKFLAENNLDKDSVRLIVVGKKAFDYAKRNGFEIMHSVEQLGEADEITAFETISEMVSEEYFNEEYNSFHVIHTTFITTTEQKPMARMVLPITESSLKSFISEIIPTRGRFAEKASEYDFEKDDVVEYSFDPNPEVVLRELIPYLLNTSLYYALLESKASEHSARMVAMKNATDKAGEVVRDLRRKFNKQRQAAITKEISEITSGMETTS